VRFGPLSRHEAASWLGQPLDGAGEEFTLAELYHEARRRTLPAALHAAGR
jgi:hypothetical protein